MKCLSIKCSNDSRESFSDYCGYYCRFVSTTSEHGVKDGTKEYAYNKIFFYYFDKQKEACALCKTMARRFRSLVIDHDHDTGFVRGLLCKSCNSHMGYFDRAVKAIKYLDNQTKKFMYKEIF